MKKQKSIGFKVGVILGVLHLCLVISAQIACSNSKSSTAGLVFIFFFFLDAPVMLLGLSSFKMFGDLGPLILFGFFGFGYVVFDSLAYRYVVYTCLSEREMVFEINSNCGSYSNHISRVFTSEPFYNDTYDAE